MRKQLFIRLPNKASAAPAQMSWVLRENDQRPVEFSGDLREAAAQAVGARVTILVPSTDVLLAQVELPGLKGQRLAKAVPYALEEQLADDVDNLHVAVGARDAAGQLASAVVSRATLETWLGQCRGAGLHPDVVSPEVFGIDWPGEETGGWSLLVEEGQALLRTDTQMGLAFDTGNALPVMRAALDSAADQQPPIIKVTDCGGQDFTGTETWRELQALCEQEGVVLTHHLAHLPGSAMLAQGFDEDTAINLLQGDYSIRGQLRKFFLPWRPVLVLVGIWLLLQVALSTMDYVQLQSRQAALQADIAQVFAKAMPGSRLVPGQEKVLMQRALNELRGAGASEQGLLALMSRAAPVLKGVNGLHLRALRYRNQTLDVDMELPDLQVVDSLKQSLVEKAGLTVDIVSASARNNKVESRFSLRTKPQSKPQTKSPSTTQGGGA